MESTTTTRRVSYPGLDLTPPLNCCVTTGDKLLSGYTHDQLDRAFRLVQNPNHWKDPIDVEIFEVPLRNLHAVVLLLRVAVHFFTGVDAKITTWGDDRLCTVKVECVVMGLVGTTRGEVEAMTNYKHRIRILVGKFEDDSVGILEALAESEWDAGCVWSESSKGLALETAEAWVTLDGSLLGLFPDLGLTGKVEKAND